MIDKFLENLSKEVEYIFGTPWRYSDKSLGVIVPILKKGNNNGTLHEERVYITLEEAKNQKISFKETGHINRVIIESSVGKPIFIRSGTALKSEGTQPRAVDTSVVILPSKEPVTKQEIPVCCIYASKPIRAKEKFTYAGHVPLEVGTMLLSRGGQSKTWSAIGHTTSRFRNIGSVSRYSSDNLVGVMEEVDKFKSDIDNILKKVPLFEEQVGAVFLDIKDVTGIEMFDHPKSWESIHKEVEKRFGENVIKEEQSFFKPDYEKIKPLTMIFLKKLLESQKTEISRNEITSTVSLKGDGVIGEATTIKGKVIHLVGMKN